MGAPGSGQDGKEIIHVQQDGLELGGNATSRVDVDEPRTNAVEKAKQEKMKKTKVFAAVSFWRLFRCADSFDYLLMFVGTVGAIVNGLTLPAMLIIQGRLINTFGTLQNQPELIYDRLKMVATTSNSSPPFEFHFFICETDVVFVV